MLKSLYENGPLEKIGEEVMFESTELLTQPTQWAPNLEADHLWEENPRRFTF
jgi:hypothetical protein